MEIKKVIISAALASQLVGCGFSYEYSTPSATRSYIYQDDFNNADIIEPNTSDYIRKPPFTPEYKNLSVDYARHTFSTVVPIKLKSKNPISVDFLLTAVYQLVENPDKEKIKKPKEDEYLQYLLKNVPSSSLQTVDDIPVRLISGEKAFEVILLQDAKTKMKEIIVSDEYEELSKIENNLLNIAKEIKSQLSKNKFFHISNIVIDVKKIPDAIVEAREDSLKLEVDALNKLKELRIERDQFAQQETMRIKRTLTDVFSDKIENGSVNILYRFVKAVEDGKVHTVNFTPDFVKLMERKSVKQASDNKSSNLYDKISKMSDQEIYEMMGGEGNFGGK